MPIFVPRYENDNKPYKANQEAVLARGRGLIVLYVKITRAFPNRGGFFLPGPLYPVGWLFCNYLINIKTTTPSVTDGWTKGGSKQ
jgi:hypothetical protein